MVLLFNGAKVTAELIGKQVVESQKFMQPLAGFYRVFSFENGFEQVNDQKT